jgi:hypothetical protein
MTIQTDGARDAAITHWVTAAVALVAIVAIRLFLPIPWIFDMNDPEFMPLILLVPLAAAFGLYHAALGLRWTLRVRRFGDSSLEIAGEVGRMGHPLTGVVRTAQPLKPEGDYRLLLRCIETHQMREVGEVARLHSRDFVVWEHSLTVPAAEVDSSRGIPFAFSLPETVRTAQPERNPNAIQFDYSVALPFAKKIWTNRPPSGTTWLLVASAPMPGTDFKAAFTVPVQQP